MLAKLRPRSAYDVMAALSLFLVLSGGTAYATHLVVNSSDVVDNSLTGTDVRGRAPTGTTAAVNGSLTTDDIAGQQAHGPTATPFVDGTLTQWDIKNGALVGGDLANNTVGGAKITDNSIKGADVDEATLGQVPSALLGGFGRSGAITSCDPETIFFEFCAGTEILAVPSGARALVLGRTLARADPGNGGGVGDCVLMTSSIGQVPNTLQRVNADTFGSSATFVGVTPPLPAGGTSFGILCRDTGGDTAGIQYPEIAASVVVISET